MKGFNTIQLKTKLNVRNKKVFSRPMQNFTTPRLYKPHLMFRLKMFTFKSCEGYH